MDVDAKAMLSTMEEALTEIGGTLASVARKQDEHDKILQAHEDAIKELRKKTGGA